jgi:DNA-binding CsgD family transcriptional regulator
MDSGVRLCDESGWFIHMLEVCIISDAMHKVIAALYDAAFQVPLTQFQDFAFEQIGCLVPHSSGVWATGNHATNQIHAVHLVNQPLDLMMRYDMAYVETDYLRARAIAEPGRSFRLEDVMSLEEYRALPAYTDLGQEIGLEYSMATAQNDPTSGLSELILLWRADRTRPFSVAECQIAQHLVPHLVAAWRHRQLVGIGKSFAGILDSESQSRQAHAIVDSNGLILAVIGNFGQQLATAVPGWIGPILPAIVVEAIQAGESSLRVLGHEIALSTANDRTIVAITLQTNLVSLSRGEMRTAQLFASGASHKQIAADLGLSTFTIRNQISSAYRKLGVHSKLALAEVIKTWA